MINDLIIVGAGGFGREVYSWAKACFPASKYRIKGFLSNQPDDLANFDNDVGILGDEASYDIQPADRFLFAIGDIDTKKRIVNHLKHKGARFLSLVHPTAVIAETAKMGEGVIIGPHAFVSEHADIADFVMMHFASSCGHDSQIGKYSILSPYATVNGFTMLEDEVFLATHATVTARKIVGYRSKVSANSVAMKDVPAHSFVYGVPGKVMTIFKEG